MNTLKDIDFIKEYLTNTLSPKRYIHSVNTAITAEKLAIIYNEDSDKAYLAGLVHDCTREADMEKQHGMLNALGIATDQLTMTTKELIHAYTAEYVIKYEFNINNDDIISAVRFHTTGKENMTLLEKIVFLSDVVEPSRSFPGVDSLRQLSMDNLDGALLAAFDSSLRFLIGKRQMVHINTILARNYVLEHFKE